MDVIHRGILATLAATLLVAAPAAAQEPGATPPEDQAAIPQIAGDDCPRSPDPPIGATFSSLDSQGRVVIAGQPVADTGGTSKVNLVVIDRLTRDPVYHASFANDAAGVAALATAESDQATAHPRQLFVVSAGGGVQAGAVNGLVKAVGDVGALPGDAEKKRLTGGAPFSIVGVQGAPDDSSWIRIYQPPEGQNDDANDTATDDVRGNMSGYLQAFTGASCEYGFVPPEFTEFTTQKAGAPAGHNVMKIGDLEVDHALPAFAEKSGGFHMVILDRTTLRVILNQVYTVNGPRDMHHDWEHEVLHLAADLQTKAEKPGRLVLIQSWGSPTPDKTDGDERWRWTGVGEELAKAGGTASVMLKLDGSGNYALVAGQSATPTPDAPTEISEPLMKRPHDFLQGHIEGVLMRNRHFDFDVMFAGPNDASAKLAKVAYQAPKPFVPFEGGEKAAVNYIIAERLKFPATDDFRRFYWTKFADDWGNYRQTVAGTQFVAGKGFTENDLTNVKTKLDGEINDVVQVQNLVAHIKHPLEVVKGESQVDLGKIGRDIRSAVAPPPASPTLSPFDAMSSEFGVFAIFLEGPAGQAAGLASMAFAMAGQLSQTDGEAVLDDEIKVKIDDIAANVKQRYNTATSGVIALGRIIVSDPSKLSTAADRTRGDAEWHWPSDDSSIINAMEVGAKRWFFTELMPIAYRTWDLINSSRANDWSCDHNIEGATVTYHPFSDEPDTGQYRPRSGFKFNTDGVPIADAVRSLAIHDWNRNARSGQPPPASLIDPLFAPVGSEHPDNLGLFKELFYAHGFDNGGRAPSGQGC